MNTPTPDQPLEQVWEQERPRLTGLAYRILGSWHDAEDVVAQSWPKLDAAGHVERPGAWLTTVVTRLAIDAGRRARTRRETYVGSWLPEPVDTRRLPADVTEQKSLLSLGMLRLMEVLEPEDRAIFVLREAFEMPYTQIADCVGRSPAACRQVVSRTRTKLHTHPSSPPTHTDRSDDQAMLDALVQAVVSGNVADVVQLVSHDCVLWADGGGIVSAARQPLTGRDRVMKFMLGISRTATPPIRHHVNGVPALLFTNPRTHGRYLYLLEHDGQHITGIQCHANPHKLHAIEPCSPA